MSYNSLNDRLGNWLGAQLSRTELWFRWVIASLFSLVITNIFLHPHVAALVEVAHTESTQTIFWTVDHSHFDFDVYPGFWSIFGLVITLVIVFILKKGVAPFICRPEDYYEHD